MAAESLRFRATSRRAPSRVSASFIGQFEGEAARPARGGGKDWVSGGLAGSGSGIVRTSRA